MKAKQLIQKQNVLILAIVTYAFTLLLPQLSNGMYDPLTRDSDKGFEAFLRELGYQQVNSFAPRATILEGVFPLSGLAQS